MPFIIITGIINPDWILIVRVFFVRWTFIFCLNPLPFWSYYWSYLSDSHRLLTHPFSAPNLSLKVQGISRVGDLHSHHAPQPTQRAPHPPYAHNTLITTTHSPCRGRRRPRSARLSGHQTGRPQCRASSHESCKATTHSPSR